MDRKQVIARLNWFYSFELNQVDLYTAQSTMVEERYTRLLLERIACIEQEHVDNIGAMIRELGGQPTRLGDRMAPILGTFAGRMLALAGLRTALRVNIHLEELAMRDYRKLLREIVQQDDPRYDGLRTIARYNHVDEDLHAAWFAKRLHGETSDW